MNLPRLKLKRIVNVDNIIGFHYAEYPRSARFQDCYDFWQMFFVDTGEWEFSTEPVTFKLQQGDCLFAPPGVIRRSQTMPVAPPNVLIISFECRSAAIKKLARRSFRLNEEERRTLSLLINEGRHAFLPPPFGRNRKSLPLQLNEQALLGSQHMVRNYLEILLVSLLRRVEASRAMPKPLTAPQENREKSVIDRLLWHIDENLGGDLSMPSLCRKFAVSRTHLYDTFKKRFGCGVSYYVRKARAEQAKRIIREETSSMTEIAARIGYSSIHYFSRDFKKIIGITPTDYAKSIQAHIGTISTDEIPEQEVHVR